MGCAATYLNKTNKTSLCLIPLVLLINKIELSLVDAYDVNRSSTNSSVKRYFFTLLGVGVMSITKP